MTSAPLAVSCSRERELFLEALDLSDPAARLEFLNVACGKDAALCQRVKELIREHEDAGDFLDTPAVDPGGVAISEETETLMAKLKPEEAGDRIGAYKLLEQIGEGGYGIVWMAEQEHPVRRQVALKIIKVGMDTKQVIARFEQERQALAIMEHPNIAKVFDAGATPFGRPFFVMELVRGIPITEYCDQARLTTRQRLMLFIRVCDAVQHAHQKGIIHRDLKPTNVLVTLHDGVPVPKVIDFGVAKAMQQRLTELTLFTGFEQMLGTPLYMSPEQAEMSGLDIDTRSDIYALGILLYQLLTGRTPLDAEQFRKYGFDDMRRVIREEEPLRPSMLLRTMPEATRSKIAQFRESEPPMLVRSVKGDLDWIVMKALEKDRTRRYETANGLARDVQRHLDSEPVLARPPTRRYRLQKLIRRNRGTFTAAFLIAAALLVGSGVSTWQAVRATYAERSALSAQKEEAKLRARAERESASARLNEYDADIALAAQSFTDGNYRRGVRLLEKHRPAPGAADLRGFEWRHLWQVAQGGEHFALPDQGSSVQILAFSPNGETLAIGSQEKLNVWNIRSASLVYTLPRSPGQATPPGLIPMFRGRGMSAASFLPGGKSLVTGSMGGVRIWSTETWTEQRVLPESGGSFVLSDDGTRIAAGKRGRPGPAPEGITLWDATTWAELNTYPTATSPMAFAPGAKYFAATTDAGIVVWPLQGEGSEVTLADSANTKSRRGPVAVSDRTLAFSPDGNFIVAARNAPSERGVFVVTVWDAKTGFELATLPTQPQHIEHTGVISAIAFSPDGSTLATASLDHSIRLWDFAKRERIATLHGHLTEVWALAFSPDGGTLATGGKGGEVKLWPTRQKPKEDPLSRLAGPLAISPDGQILLAWAGSDAIGMFDITTGDLLKRFEVEASRPRGPGPVPGNSRGGSNNIAVSADTRVLAQGLSDGRVQTWDTTTGATNYVKACEHPVEMIALSPDGSTLLASSRSDRLRTCTISTGTIEEWPIKPIDARFSPNGAIVAVYQWKKPVELWDVATRSLRVTLETQAEFGGTGVFSPDSHLFAMPSSEDTIQLWDVFTGESVGVFAGHKQPVLSIAFSPDGRTLASSGDDSTVRMWNVATQQELLVDRQLGGTLSNLLFSPDGRLLLGSKGSSRRSLGLQVYRAPVLSEIASPRRPE